MTISIRLVIQNAPEEVSDFDLFLAVIQKKLYEALELYADDTTVTITYY